MGVLLTLTGADAHAYFRPLSRSCSAQDERAAEGDGGASRIAALVEREARIGFTPASSTNALLAMDDPRQEELRPQALMTLGVLGSVSSRPLLEKFSQHGVLQERCAAVLALGELGAKVAGADLLLMELLADPEPSVAECALYSLLLTRPKVGRVRGEAYVASPDHPLNAVSQALMDWVDGKPTLAATPALRLLTLRWEAARSFGTIDGVSWRMLQIKRLTESEILLDSLILPRAAELGSSVVRDYLLELLLEREARPVVVRAAVIAMPAELDELIATGLWAPRSPEEWEALVDEAEVRGLFRSLPRALERAAQVESLLARVAPHLASADERYFDAVDGLLGSRDAARRAQSAYAIGEARLTRFLPRLVRLKEDKSVAVRAAATVARARLGDLDVLAELVELFIEGRDLHRGNFREREFLLEAMYKTRRSSTTQLLLESLSGRMRDMTELAERQERASMLAIMRLGGHTVDTTKLQEFFGDRSFPKAQQIWLLEALGELPNATVQKLLEGAFPLDGGWRSNLPLVRALLDIGSESVAPLLQSAVWHGPTSRSVLAAALVEDEYGLLRLMQWIGKPPTGATSSDLRRVGYAVGLLGRLTAVDTLQRQLGAIAGAERPALQGALLGALTSRTR
ncbi:MAG: HEAT repeat protein [Planctomycetota bacterium]|jgi:HEAT repeat protein